MEVILAIIGSLVFVWLWKKTNENNKSNNESDKYDEQMKVKATIIERKTLPLVLTSQLLEDEDVYYFSYLVLEKNEGGCCGSTARADYWIALTNKRILYKTKIKDNEKVKLYETNGIIPFDKIAGIEIVQEEENLGCSGESKCYELHIGSMGKVIIIPLPTERKGFEIRKIYMEVIEIVKQSKKENNDE